MLDFPMFTMANKNTFFNSLFYDDFEEFKQVSNVVANRFSSEILGVGDKVCSRGLFNTD